VLLVSHDRTFLEATCDRLLLLEGGQLHDLTRVEDGLDRLSQGEARETGAAKPVTQARSAPQPATEDDPHPTVSLWQAEKDLDALHHELEAATTAIDAIDAQLGNPQSLDAAALAAAGRERVQLEASVETLLAHGESLERAIAAKRNAKQRSR
jgi:ABC-type glutathione transport system ATPase component